MISQIGPKLHTRSGLVPNADQVISNGLQIQNIDVRVIMRGGAAAVGDVLQFDLSAEDGDVSTVDIGSDTSIFRNVSAPTATGVAGGSWNCVALEAIADNAEGLVRVFGICQAYVIAASGSPAIGSRLVPTTAKNFDLVSAAGESYRAMSLAAVTTPTTRELATVLVNGIGSFGIDHV